MKGRKEMEISGVRTVNFPFELIDGEEHYFLHAGVVVEIIAERIPPEAKQSVTIDYDKILETYFRKVKEESGGKSVDPNTAAENERQLIETLEKGNAFITK